MRNLFTAMFAILFIIGAFGQAQLIKGQNIDPYNLRNELSSEDYVHSILDSYSEKYTFLNKLDQQQFMNTTDWIKLYNMLFPDTKDNNNVYSPAIRLRKELINKYKNNPVLITIGKNISLPKEDALQKIKQNLKLKIISITEAELALDNITWEKQDVFGVGVYTPRKRFDKQMKILKLNEYQFLDPNYTVTAPLLNDQYLEFSTISGTNTVSFNLEKFGEKIKTIETEIISITDAERYIKNAEYENQSVSRARPCNQPYGDNYEVRLTTGLDCTGGCDPDDETLMQGQVVVVPSSDGIIDHVLMITDGIDYVIDGQSRSGWEILNEDLGGVETFRHLLDFGIDIMIVDWPSEAGWIQNNSAYLQHIIAELNKSPDFVAIETLVGISMGGPITRHALLEMESRGETHNVRNWVAGDAPLQGANIPIGVQAFIRESYLLAPDYKLLEDLNVIISSPAPRQMLLYHLDDELSGYDDYDLGPWPLKIVKYGYITPQPDPEFLDLQAYFDDRGLPSNTTKNMTIVDGADGNNPVSHAGYKILHTDIEVLTGITFPIKAFAADGKYGSVALAKLYPFIGPYFTHIDGIDDIDAAPGSIFPTSQIISPLLKWGEKSFTFIPTYSALGIIDGDLHNFNIEDSPFYDPNDPLANILINGENDEHSTFVGAHKGRKFQFLIKCLDNSLLSTCNYEPCDKYKNTLSTAASRDIWGKEDNYRVFFVDVNHFSSPVDVPFYFSLGKSNLTAVSASSNPPSWVLGWDYNFNSENEINFTVDIDRDYVEQLVEKLPIDPNYRNQSFTLQFPITVNVQYECRTSGNIYEKDIVYWQRFTYNVTDQYRFDPEEGCDRCRKSSENESEKINDISIFPNPTRDELTINSTDGTQNYELSLTDMLGRTIEFIPSVSNGDKVDVSKLSPGLYLLINHSGNQEPIRFIKQ